MAVIVASTSALSVAANSKSSEQVSGTYQYIGKGTLTLVALASATGLNCTLSVNGVPLIDDAVIPFTGTAGTISVANNTLVSQAVAGGRVSLTFRNTTGGAVTVDSQLLFTPK